MKKIVLKFGLISGVILGTLTGILMPICLTRGVDLAYSQVVGYSAMVISFLAVFFGIRRYREDVGGGAITFGKAFQVGILIALIGCAMYVIGWEIAYWGFIPDFGDRYAAIMLEKMRAGGASAETMAIEEAKMARFRELYRKPLFNIGMTFLEVAPVGLIVTIISAAILKKRRPEPQPQMAAG